MGDKEDKEDLEGRLSPKEYAEKIISALTPFSAKFPFFDVNLKLFGNYKHCRGILAEGSKYYDNKDYAGAEQGARNFVEVLPAYSMGHWVLGQVLNRQGKLEEAIREYEIAMYIHKSIESRSTNIMVSPSENRKQTEALIALEPNNVGPYLDWAVFLYLRGDIRESAKYYAKSLEIAGNIGQVREISDLFDEIAGSRKPVPAITAKNSSIHRLPFLASTALASFFFLVGMIPWIIPGYALTYLTLKLAEISLTERQYFHEFYADLHELTGDYSGARKKIVEAIDMVPLSRFYVRLGDLYLKEMKGKLEEVTDTLASLAMTEYNKAIELNRLEEPSSVRLFGKRLYSKPKERLPTPTTEVIATDKYAGIRNISEALRRVFGRHNDKEGGIEILNAAAKSESPFRFDFQCLHANLLQSLGDPRAEYAWREAIINLLTTGRGFETKGEYRNEFLLYTDSKFISEFLGFKRGRIENGADHLMQQEYNNLVYFRSMLGREVCAPINWTVFGGYGWLITRQAGKENLTQAAKTLNPDQKLALVRGAVDILNKIHQVGRQGYSSGKLLLEDVVANDGKYFEHRIGEKLFCQLVDTEGNPLIPPDTQGKIITLYNPINDNLAKLKTRSYYKDANPGNSVKTPEGKLVAVDFEGDKLLPIFLDLVSLLEFEGVYLGRAEVLNLLDRYILNDIKLRADDTDTRNKIERLIYSADYSGRPYKENDAFRQYVAPETEAAFLTAYEFAAVHRHLEIIGYKQRDFKASKRPEDNIAKGFHLGMASQHLEAILTKELLPQYDARKTVELASLVSNLKVVL